MAPPPSPGLTRLPSNLPLLADPEAPFRPEQSLLYAIYKEIALAGGGGVGGGVVVWGGGTGGAFMSLKEGGADLCSALGVRRHILSYLRV